MADNPARSIEEIRLERLENGAAYLVRLEQAGMMESQEYRKWFPLWLDLLRQYESSGAGLAVLEQQSLL